jgi:hypothetical protein
MRYAVSVSVYDSTCARGARRRQAKKLGHPPALRSFDRAMSELLRELSFNI